MSEPTAYAHRIDRLEGGVLHWTVQDDRIQFRSDAYGVNARGGAVWIDPLPLAQPVLETVGRVVAICLTAGTHQRSAWRFRRMFSVPVYAPRGAVLDETPDHWCSDGDRLPGELRVIGSPGVQPSDIALLRESDVPRALFCGDLLVRRGEEPLSLIDEQYLDDRAAALKSLRRLADLAPDMICPAHGAPWSDGGAAALQDALRRAAE